MIDTKINLTYLILILWFYTQGLVLLWWKIPNEIQIKSEKKGESKNWNWEKKKTKRTWEFLKLKIVLHDFCLSLNNI